MVTEVGESTDSAVAARRVLARAPGRTVAGPAVSGEQDRRLVQLGRALLEVAHEVRSSLGGIQLYASLLGQQLAEGGQARRLADKVLAGMVHLSALVEDLLLFGETGALSRRECYLLDVLEQALGFAHPYLEEKSIRVTRLYAGELRPMPADARLLTSVFLNLILNAVEAMSGGGELVVAVRPEPPDGLSQEVRFEDTGPGFSGGNLAGVSAPFVGEKPGGAGLGLTVARHIVLAHGGSIELANRKRGGAMVRVRLPVG